MKNLLVSMMIGLSLILVNGVGANAADPRPGKTAPSLPDKGTVLSNINLIEKDPLSEKAKEAYKLVIGFAVDSDDVQVDLNGRISPWVNNNSEDSDLVAKLLGAYMAGNVKYQLTHNIKKNNTAAGLDMVFAVYSKIRESHQGFVIKEIEEQMALKKNHKLDEFIRTHEKLQADDTVYKLKSGQRAPSIQ